MRIATGGMCSKESGMESNKTFMSTSPYCHAVIRRRAVKHSNGDAYGPQLYRSLWRNRRPEVVAVTQPFPLRSFIRVDLAICSLPPLPDSPTRPQLFLKLARSRDTRAP